MRQKLYLECTAGISGDMMVGALLDLGADEKKLRRTLESLNLDGYSVEVKRVKKSGLDVCDFTVNLDAAHENHDHDMGYLHGKENAHGHFHTHGEDAHRHMHGEDVHQHMPDGNADKQEHAHTHTHEHRGLPEIIDMIQSSGMSDRAKMIACRIFDILAQAEAKAHGVPPEQVHFHEVGAVDSIVDISATAICLDDLGMEDVVVPVLCEGCGTIRCQHGILPIPVPATLNIVTDHHLKLHRMEAEGEFVTPTGAAIAAAIRTEDRLPECFRVERVGMGAGKRNYECPSVLRAMLIVPENEKTDERSGNMDAEDVKTDEKSGNTDAEDEIVKLECNIDDCSGEAVGYAMERLFAAGAGDVHYTPVFMKKNRPAYMLTVLCTPNRREIMEEILFTETTTIGIRRQRMKRSVLKREICKVNTSLGEAVFKKVEYHGVIRYVPEYESAAALARESRISFLQVYRRLERELNESSEALSSDTPAAGM
ncbi:MAG: nickel pincer cofactor biosynthesis protein LarC [Clostridiales bacterium]|nr:nickel pincer cofactor biosynthesis protein LarC [Clostridiales bacterium]